MVAILPDTIPEDAAPLETIEAEPQDKNFFAFTGLNGRNVFVQMNDGKHFVGHLEIVASKFYVGKSDLLEYFNIHSFREV